MKRIYNLIWSHVRDINVRRYKDTITYRIPLYYEVDALGTFKEARMEGDHLVIEYHLRPETNLPPPKVENDIPQIISP